MEIHFIVIDITFFKIFQAVIFKIPSQGKIRIPHSEIPIPLYVFHNSFLRNAIDCYMVL